MKYEGIVVLVLVVLAGLGLTFVIYSSLSDEKVFLSPGSGVAVLGVYDTLNEKTSENGICYVTVSGEVRNLGEATATNSRVICRPMLFPSSFDTQLSFIEKDLSLIPPKEKVAFVMKEEIDCDSAIKLECSASCDNC